MRFRHPSVLATVGVAAAVAACAVPPPPSQSVQATPEAITAEILTLPSFPPGAGYAGVGLEDLTLHGNPTAEPGKQVWVTWDGGRHSPGFPYGWTAVFDPELIVLDAAGSAKLREGQTFDAGGTLAEDGTIWIIEIDGELVVY